MGILSPKSRPFMSTTTFTIKANGWAPSTTFDGSQIKYTRTTSDHVPASPEVDFPGPTDPNSPWLTNENQPGVAIIFGKIVGESPDQSWQWLAPSVSGSNLTFTVSDTSGDDTTVVYVFTIGTNHGQAVAYSPFAFNNIATGGGQISDLKIYYGTYKLGTIQWGYESSSGIVPLQYKFVYDTRTQPINITIDNNPFIASSKLSSINSIHVSYLYQTFTDFSIDYRVSCDMYIIYSTNSYITSISYIDHTVSDYNLSTDGNHEQTLNSHIESIGARIQITNTGLSTFTVNDFIATNPPLMIDGPVVYNRAIEVIGNEPIPHVSSLQTVQTNLQTIYDRLGGAMVEAEGYGITRQYFAAGDFADRIWERFNELINEGTVGTNITAITDQLNTVFRGYGINVPNDSSDAASITVQLDSKTYSLYIEHEGAYYAVMSSQSGITVDGVSGGATWETLTGGDIVINGRLFYNNVSQPIIADWTTEELKEVGTAINIKTAVIVGGKKYPLITFKNISPSLIWINESDGV